MSKPTPRIVGSMLNNYIGKDVILAGIIQMMSSSHDVVELLTFDGVKVNVTLKRPLEADASGVLEVWGTVRSKATISANRFVHFPGDDCKDIDPRIHSYLANKHNQLNDDWILPIKKEII